MLAAIVIKMPPGLEEIGPEYLANRRAELPGMMELLQRSDFKRLAVLGHDLKGTGASYGFPDLTRLGSAIEHSAHEADMGALGVQLAELGEYLGQIELCAEV